MDNVGFPTETVCCALGLLIPAEVPGGHSRSTCSLHKGLGVVAEVRNENRSSLPSHLVYHDSCYPSPVSDRRDAALPSMGSPQLPRAGWSLFPPAQRRLLSLFPIRELEEAVMGLVEMLIGGDLLDLCLQKRCGAPNRGSCCCPLLCRWHLQH